MLSAAGVPVSVPALFDPGARGWVGPPAAVWLVLTGIWLLGGVLILSRRASLLGSRRRLAMGERGEASQKLLAVIADAGLSPDAVRTDRSLNLGMADAVSAARAIVNGKVDDYSEERHRIGVNILKKTEAARKMVTSNSPIAKAIVWVAAKAISSSPITRRAFMRLLTQI